MIREIIFFTMFFLILAAIILAWYCMFIMFKFGFYMKNYQPEILKKYNKKFFGGFKLFYAKKVLDDEKMEKYRKIIWFCYITLLGVFTICAILGSILWYLI